MVIPSSLDHTLAPPGAHVCLLFTQFTPYTLAGGRVWDTMVKEEYAQKVRPGSFFLRAIQIVILEPGVAPLFRQPPRGLVEKSLETYESGLGNSKFLISF